MILTGGTLRKNSYSLVGPLAEDSLRRLSADLLFLAVDGFDVPYGLTTPNQLEARVNRADDRERQDHRGRVRFKQVRLNAVCRLIAPTSAVALSTITDSARHSVRGLARTPRKAGVRSDSCHRSTDVFRRFN